MPLIKGVKKDGDEIILVHMDTQIRRVITRHGAELIDSENIDTTWHENIW